MNIDLDKLEKTALAAKQGEWAWEIHDESMATLVACAGDIPDTKAALGLIRMGDHEVITSSTDDN